MDIPRNQILRNLRLAGVVVQNQNQNGLRHTRKISKNGMSDPDRGSTHISGVAVQKAALGTYARITSGARRKK